MRQAVPSEIARCLEAIHAFDPKSGVRGATPAKVWVLDFPESTSFHVLFVDPKTLPIGEIYDTWVVTVSAPEEVKVIRYRSRRGAGGDDTVPPE